MIFGCGIDIEEIIRFDKHYFEKGQLSHLIYDIFTSREIENFSVFGKEAFLKGFCFKEAFYKAIHNSEISWFDVEIIFNIEQSFEIFYSDVLKLYLNSNEIAKIDVNFERTGQYVICKVILVK
ncbi:MAG: hypothetical protein A2X13_03795 [Bacteroidetes bacterium GWC2_33_15]|nr:MAG: hypothetical protein A2X10_02445 [Bacteroidetes bacterium GWA2_33_15]OFX49648.1 MAG: hypothetical protein A2X13_03795 [Bacteroidetes bacterium GWC2_33_15]OFX65962.1 MAG: hypothetical protein A2X15_11040 [Bacteroidetes bacterium GWB2_32_14]OFX68277.1 MAG: hypothetical protein A2X14_07855 [Bacteroidetes bacterium GWD2_33_33]HAN18058.1 hypothetical protein [Bacteroidales bacterium]